MIYQLQPGAIAPIPASAMLFAILLPGISMIFRGHVLKGILCGILHLTLIGWIPAAIWAVASYQRDLADERHRETMDMLARQGRR